MKTILLVEDDDTLRKTLAYNLSKEDYKVVQTGDGEEGTIAALKHGDLHELEGLHPATSD
jgi:DNA-binding response OmpR family regulator